MKNFLLTTSSTFVLVHGAWHGGWCWQRVADLLRQEGHRVFTPTLTGLADRSHLLSPGIGLSTHIADVVNLMRWEDLTDVVLCGHSYGGMVVTGVTSALPNRIRSIVYLDALVPDSGRSMLDYFGAEERAGVEAAALSDGLVAPIPALAFVNEADRAWVDAKCTPQPIATFRDPIPDASARDGISRRVYVRAGGFSSTTLDQFSDSLRRDGSWTVLELPYGHDLMIDAPSEVAELLLDAAAPLAS